MHERFDVECEDCGTVQMVSAETFPACEHCESFDLIQRKPA